MYSESPAVDNCAPKTTGMALNHMCVSRQRACIFTNPTFKEIRNMAREEALDIETINDGIGKDSLRLEKSKKKEKPTKKHFIPDVS